MTTLNIVIAEIILCLVLAWLLGYFISWLFAKGAKTKYESEIQELHSGIEERDSSIGKLDDDNIQHIVALRENKMALMVANDKVEKSILEQNEVDSKLKSTADELELSKSENQELNNTIVLNKKELLGLKEKNSQLKKIDSKLKVTIDKLEESKNENLDLNNTILLNKEKVSTLKEKNAQIKERLLSSINEFDISLEKQKQKTGDILAKEEKSLLEIKKLQDENRELKLVTKESSEILNTTKKIEELCKKNGDSKELEIVVKKYASLLERATKAKQGTIDYLKAELEEKDNALKEALEIKDKAEENPFMEKIFDRIQKFKS